MKPPQSLTDLRLFNGMLGFYQDWIPLLEIRLDHWRQYQKQCPPSAATKEQEKDFLNQVWTAQDEKLRLEVLDEVKARLTLARPNYNRRFYLKTDWCAQGRAAVLLQADPDDADAKKAELIEQQRGPCQLDLTLQPQNLRLHPLAFISQRSSVTEQAYHSHYGEAKAGMWAMRKFRQFLIRAEFTCMTDSSSIKQFFESTEKPTHAEQRLRLELLFYTALNA